MNDYDEDDGFIYNGNTPRTEERGCEGCVVVVAVVIVIFLILTCLS